MELRRYWYVWLSLLGRVAVKANLARLAVIRDVTPETIRRYWGVWLLSMT
jgi:hypothetical protein